MSFCDAHGSQLDPDDLAVARDPDDDLWPRLGPATAEAQLGDDVATIMRAVRDSRGIPPRERLRLIALLLALSDAALVASQ